MKLRNIFTMFASLLALAFTSCEVEEGRFLDEVKVSQSYVAIPAEGGTVEVTVDAADAWEITGVPEWLTVNPLKGEAGQTIVKFTAEPATSTNEAQVTLNCAGASQIISVLQMTEKIEPPLTELNTILTSGEVGVFYRVKGTVAEVPLKDFQSYGKFYITDSSTDSKVQIYGLANKAEYLDKSNNPTIDVGDVVVIEGSWSSYSNFNNDTKILSVEKSLIKIESVEYVSNSDAETPEAGEGDAPAEGEGEGEEEAAPSELSKEGGKVIVTLTVKGDGVSVDIPEEAKAWLSIAGLTTSGTTAVVTFDAAANQAGDRTVEISFLTTSEGVEYSALTTIAQKGSILNATIPEFLAAAEDATLYRISGNIKSLSVSDQYHNANVTIVDGAGNEAYLYRLVSNEKNIEELGLKEGDYLTVVGKRSSYNGSPQMAQGCYIESYVSYVPATISEFLAAEVSDVMYRVSGVIVNIKEVNAQYGNANLTIADDAGNELYIYRMKPAEGGKAIDEIGFKEGDVLTVVGKRSEYNDSPQMGSPIYVSHEEGASEEPAPEDPTTLTLTNEEICAAMTSSETSYQDYTIESESGIWTVNASKNNANTYLQCRGKKGAYIKTPVFENDIKSVTIHFTDKKSVYANNTYCVFPATWTVPTEDAAYPEDGNVGKAVTDGSYSLTIPVDAGNKLVYISIIGTYAYYLDHIDVEF